jgi:hypothetical protein
MTTTSDLGELARAWHTLAKQYRQQGDQAIIGNRDDPQAALVLYSKAEQLDACATALAEHIMAGLPGGHEHTWPRYGKPGDQDTCQLCQATRTIDAHGNASYEWPPLVTITSHAQRGRLPQPAVKAIRCQDQGCPGSLADGLPPALHSCPLGRGLYPTT